MTRDDAFHVIGVATRTSNVAEGDPATARLPELWQRAYADQYLAPRRERDGADLIAVLTDYESDHTGSYTQVVGVRVASLDEVPERLVAVRVPSENRQEVLAHGAMPDALIAAWQQVWQRTEAGRLTRGYRTDYEVHTDDGATIHLSVDGCAPDLSN